MNTTITWLHLSDLHACPGRTGWDANHVMKSLCNDLKELQRDYKLRPDFIFFTGDAAFGQLGDQPGMSLQDQYRAAQQFLDQVRCSFRPELTARDIYFVPGNHDVNRDDIDSTQTSWLRDPSRSLEDIVTMMQAGKAQWRRFMERLEDYKAFLKSNGYDHLLTDDKNRLIFADAREVAGLRVGIAGLNSAWSCFGGVEEKALLWCGGKYQVEELLPLLSKADFSIALIHHPGNWFVAKEDPNVQRLLETTFEFVLHGHEHQEWVKTDARTGHTTIWAGPCYDRSDRRNGFNVVQLNRNTGKAKVWLREYKDAGRGWVACNIKTLAPRGIWALDQLNWLRELRSASGLVIRKNQPRLADGSAVKNSPAGPKAVSRRAAVREKTADFERRLCEAMMRKYDYLELFGADIPRESQRHALSVAYVSLNLCQEDEGDGQTAPISPIPAIGEPPKQSDELESFVGGRPVDEVFDRLSPSTGRLLMRGVAGGGKSTLLRWASIQAAKFNLQSHGIPGDAGIVVGDTICKSALPSEFENLSTPLPKSALSAPAEPADSAHGEPAVAQVSDWPNWRTKIPFLIRLRDCPDGKLPRPKDLPALIAKELPDPPPEWIDQVLTEGRGLLLFDGVDEIPTDKRDLLALEIENLINAYPKNYCIVSTRPGAVDRGWLSKLKFFEARIEPMSPDDQDEFIDKWYSAVSAELRASGRRAENLDKLATSLKQELRDTPTIAKLAIYPLLCAMICALYRERNQKLPETQAALCEDLCKILLHRRERETPDMKLVHLPSDYRKLDYEHKRYIVAELAKFMVEQGISSLDELQADSLLALALHHFPDHAKAKAPEMRRALVERSGLLRPSGANRIDFLHNTLKEYLAAGRFVADDAYKLLASHAEDDAWQPVILFASALPTPGFASRLMRELLKGIRRGKKWKDSEAVAQGDALAIAAKRNREFFVVRCRNAAFRLEPGLVEAVDRLASGLFPPGTIADAEALATLGDAIVPHLDPKQRLATRQKVACIRALRLVGGPKAKSLLKKFSPGKAKSVLLELIVASAELGTPVKLTDENLDLSCTSVRDLASIKGQTVLRSLNLANTKVSDLSPLAALSELQRLNLSETPVVDLAPLSSLASLHILELRWTRTRDFSPLAQLTDLEVLNLGRTRLAVFDAASPFWRTSNTAEFTNQLEEFLFPQTGLFGGAPRFGDRWYPYVHPAFQRELQFMLHRLPNEAREKFSPIAEAVFRVLGPVAWKSEAFSGLYTDADTLGFPEALERLSSFPGLFERLLSEIHIERGLDPRLLGEWLRKQLARASTARQEPVRSLLAPLSGLQNLKFLGLAGLPVCDLSALSNLRRLSYLDLSGTVAFDLSPLAHLSGLRMLAFSGCLAKSVVPLSELGNLQMLDLSGARISDISPLVSLKSLEALNLTGTQVADVSPLHGLHGLKVLCVSQESTGDRRTRAMQAEQLKTLKKANPGLQVHRVRW